MLRLSCLVLFCVFVCYAAAAPNCFVNQPEVYFNPDTSSHFRVKAQVSSDCAGYISKERSVTFQIGQRDDGGCNYGSKAFVTKPFPLGGSDSVSASIPLEQFELGDTICVRGKVTIKSADGTEESTTKYGKESVLPLSYLFTEIPGYLAIDTHGRDAKVLQPHFQGQESRQVTAYAAQSWTARTGVSIVCIDITNAHKYTVFGITDNIFQQNYIGYMNGFGLRLDGHFYYWRNTGGSKPHIEKLEVKLDGVITACLRAEWETSSLVFAIKPEKGAFRAVRLLTNDPHLRNAKSPLYPAVSAAAKEVLTFVPPPEDAFKNIETDLRAAALCE